MVLVSCTCLLFWKLLSARDLLVTCPQAKSILSNTYSQSLYTHPDSSNWLSRSHIMQNHCSNCKLEYLLGYSAATVTGGYRACNSPEKWLHNRIYCPSNRSKQIQETHMAYSTSTQYTRQSLNDKQRTWLHRRQLFVCEAMYVVFHSNFAAYVVCRRYKPCEFLGFVWTDCWGNKSYYIITSPANSYRAPSKYPQRYSQLAIATTVPM